MSVTTPECLLDLSRAGLLRGHAVQLEKVLALASRVGADIREEPRWFEFHRQVHRGTRDIWTQSHRAQC